MKTDYTNILKEIREYIGTAKYDREGILIMAFQKNGDEQHLLDVRGWGHLQNKFGSEQDAIFFQDAIGQFVTDAINEKLASLPSPPCRSCRRKLMRYKKK